MSNIVNFLISKNIKIAIAESCTGGLLSYKFTSIPNSSKVFLGSVISYSNDMKRDILGVDQLILQKYTAVSKEVVEQMCEGILNLTNADYALATSGIAGPDGGSENNPVGSVFIGIQKNGDKPIVKKFLFSGDREEIQSQACNSAIEILFLSLTS